MISRSLLLFFLAIFAFGANAQFRAIPVDAKRGEIRHLSEAVVEIDGTPQRLAPGAQIRDASNLIIQPVALPAGARVKYRLDVGGQVREVWILTPQEAEKP